MTAAVTTPARPSRAARTRLWLTGNGAFALVIAVLVVGVVYLAVATGHWRRGTGIIAADFLLAGVLRLVLPQARAGLLAIRAKWLDAVFYLVLGGLVLGVAIRLH